jgi:arylsulfatase A-like enzyme
VRRLWIVCLLLTACSRERGGPPNVVLVSIDSLRADHLGCYGYGRATSPTLDRLADEGVLFENATSSTSWTLPAHASMFTGLPNSAHGLDAPARVLSPERATLAEALQARGYRTAGFWSGPFLHPRFGLGQGFDHYVNCAGFAFDSDPRRANDLAHEDVTSPRLVEEVTRFLDDVGDQPFFLFVHMWDVHYDYIPPPPYDTLFDPDYDGPVDGRGVANALEDLAPRDLEHLIALYDGEIAWTDRHLGLMLERLDELGLAGDTVVLVTADHGEEFFEHGLFGHRKTLFEESIAVPLVVRAPGIGRRGLRVAEPVGIVDLAPTILELAGVPPLADVLGRSLVPLLNGHTPDAPGVEVVSELSRRESLLLSVRIDDRKVILDRTTGEPIGYWNLAEDPGELKNLLETGVLDEPLARRVQATNARLQALAERHALRAIEGPLPTELEERLRDLGYIGEDE